MENGQLGVTGNPAAKLAAEEEDQEVENATHLHQWEPGEIVLVHPQRQVNAMKKTVHLVRFAL